MEVEKEELRRQLYSSLRQTGVLDSMKGQLRARLLEHLRQQSGGVMEAANEKPSLTERLLSSLFLEYLEAHGFTFTISVFRPESQMASWPPFSYHEMLELLHLDPCIRLKVGAQGRACLAYQLLTVLQQMAQRSCIQEVSTQTSTSPIELEVSMKGVENPCVGKKEAQRLLPYRSLEDKISILHQEFDARVNAEVALQVSRLREFEINAARMDEAARYRRQLARDREELEGIHQARIERIKAREESLLERMLFKEKAIEASAFEQRQKILAEITALRERESKLRQFKEHREEKLDERELTLRAKEEEVVRVRQTLYAQADDIATLRRKELEEQYKELCDRLHHDQTLLKAERERMKEDKAAMTIELVASKELVQALQRRQSVEEDQRLSLVRTIRELEEKLKQQSVSVTIPDQQLLNLQAELEQERLQRQAREKEIKTLERLLQQKKVELAATRSPRVEWVAEHKNLLATIHQQEAELHRKETKLQLMETEREKMSTKHRMHLRNIDHLETLVKKAQEGEDRAICNLEILRVQHTVDERELLETVMLLRKAQQALEAERLENRQLRSHMNAAVPSISLASQRDSLSQDQFGHSNDLFDRSSCANQAFRTRWESSNWKPKRESPDLWTEYASSQRVSLDQNRECDHFQTKFAVSKSFSSGFCYDGTANTSVTRTESLLETVVNGSIEEYYMGSWDQERYSGYRYEDAIPSWRKTYLPEVARPNHRCEWTKGVCSSSRDPGSAWNHGERDRTRRDMAYFRGEEKVGEKYESSNGLQDSEMAAQIRSTNILDPSRKFDDSERKGFFSLSENLEEVMSLQGRYTKSSRTVEDATTTKNGSKYLQNTMEIEFQERPASSVHEHEKPFSKEEPTNNDEEEHSPSRAYGLTASATVRTNMDVTSVEDSNIKKDSIISLGSETSLQMTQGINESLLTERNTPVVRPTEADNDHRGKQGAETPWNVFLAREPNENTKDSSEAEESLTQDAPGGRKRISSSKYELESSYYKGDHHETVGSTSDVSKSPSMNPEIDIIQRLDYTFLSEPQIENLEEDKPRQSTQERKRGTTDETLKLTNEEAIDDTPMARNKALKETPSPTTSTRDSDIAQDPDSELSNQLGHTTVATHDEQKKSVREKDEELLSSEKALSLSQAKTTLKEESRRLVHENQVSEISGKMSGLPAMMFEQEIHAEGDNLQDQHSANEDQAQEAPATTVADKFGDTNLMGSSQATKQSARDTSIVIRKQEVTMEEEVDRETGKELSPRLLNPMMGSHKNHPILTIRNNQQVKLGELPKQDSKTTPLELNEETPITLSSPAVETKEPPRHLVDETSNMQHASQPTRHAPEETPSSNEGSVYKGDSFEDEEDDVGQETSPTYSEESCTNEGISLAQPSEQTRPGSLRIEQSSLDVRLGAHETGRVLGEPSENWDGASEQGSYSPDEDDAEADSVESVETCMTQGTTEAHEDQAIS